ncbi:TetR family transcriptional regulator [Acinetobacter calcoaceticus]|uniref:TetR family transcriptional regulator n=1 Tax=Acinetobacter calcoaceticus TaxID=471 RepID=A0A4R1XM74_ACICA|nr:TetR family transcriptional regulator [Acinetobacter calcoaceticus]
MIASSLNEIQPIACFEANPRGRLLSAAAYLFKKQGYDKTTVRQIAQFIGIQSGSLFHHFGSKDEILAAVMHEVIIYNHAQLSQAAQRSTDPTLQLKQLIKAELSSISGDTGAAMTVLIYEWQAVSADKQSELLELRDQYEQIWLDVIQKLVDQGKIKQDAFIWRRLIAGAIAWTVNWYKADGAMDLEQLTEIVLDMAVRH